METENILDITFVTPNLNWENQIRSMLGSSQKASYCASSLHVTAIAIAIKTQNLGRYAWNVNKSASQANEILRRNTSKTTLAVNNHTPYLFRNDQVLYSIIGETGAFLIELKSIFDLTIRYANTFYRTIFGLKKKRPDILRELERNGINLGWLSDLDGIRNDFVHHYSPWIKFRKRGQAYDFILSLPDSLLRMLEGKKRHGDEYIDALKIREYVKNSEKFFNAIVFLLKKELRSRPA